MSGSSSALAEEAKRQRAAAAGTARFSVSPPGLRSPRSVTYLTPSLRDRDPGPGPAPLLPTATRPPGSHVHPWAGIPHRAAACGAAAPRAVCERGNCLGGGGRVLPRLSGPSPAPRKHGGIGNRSAPAGRCCWRRRGHLRAELRSAEGGTAPQSAAPARRCGLHTHTHTYVRTRVRTRHGARARQRGAGPRPVSALGAVPRVRARPPTGARARFGGQSVRRGEFHARAVRPALTLAIAAEGRGRRARKRRVSGGCRDRVGVAVVGAGGDTASTEPRAGRAAPRPWRVRPEPGACIVCGAVFSEPAEEGARRLRSVPAVSRPACPGPRRRFPAERRNRGPAAPGCVGEASWHVEFRGLRAGIALSASDGSGDWRGSVLLSLLIAWKSSLPSPQLSRGSPCLETCWPLMSTGKVHIPSGNIRRGGGQADFVVSSFGKREAERWHAWQRAGRCWGCPHLRASPVRA